MLKESVGIESIIKTALYGRFRSSALKHKFFSRGTSVLIGVSGGIDSVVLLRLMHALSVELAFTPVVCHLNHNLRGSEAERDLNFTAALAADLGLLFESKTLKPGEIADIHGSPQSAAREARYAFFASAAAKADASCIVTAHTKDDVAETMLMRFINGTALGGLTGIAAVRGPYARPLLGFTRADIEEFATETGQLYVEDSSNRSEKYLRNDIRHNLTGLLKERYNPNLLESLSRSAETLRRDDDFLNESAAILFDSAVKARSSEEVLLDRGVLLQAHPALISRALLTAAEHFGARARFYSTHVESMLLLMSAENPSALLNLPGGLCFVREYEELRLRNSMLTAQQPFDLELTVPGRAELPESRSCSTQGSPAAQSVLSAVIGIEELPPEHRVALNTVYFDLDSIERTGTVLLRLRSFSFGDTIVPFGHKGFIKVKKLFIDAKVPRRLRLTLPLLTHNGTIIWVAGIKRSALYPVTEQSRRLLRVEFLK